MKNRSRPCLDNPCTKVLIASLVLFLVIPMMPDTASLPAVRRPDPALDLAGGTDVPVLGASDFWNYTTEFEYELMGFSIPFSGWLNMSVVQVMVDPFIDLAPVYITNVTGNISGHFYIPFIISVDIYIELDGFMWSKVQDLAMYRTVLNASVSGSIPSLNGHYPFGYEFSPPLEEYDFPLVKGDTWWTNVSARLPFGTSGDVIDMNSSNSLGAAELLTVPAGTFSVLPISIEGKRSLFYNSTVGNTVRRTYELDLEGTLLSVPLDLLSYGRRGGTIGLDLKISSPQPVRAGSSFSVSGSATVTNTAVTLFFPDGTIAAFIPLLLGDRDFDTVLNAPSYPDDTLTPVDHGSFGVLAVLGALDAMDVVTVTTWATDVRVNDSSLEVTHTGGGTIDDTFTATIKLYNPSNYAARDLTIRLVMEGTWVELLNSTGNTVPAKEVLTLSVDFDVDVPGNYNLSLTVDPEDNVPETDEANNAVRKGFSVLDRKPILWSVGPDDRDLQVLEGGSVELSAMATRGGVRLEGAWTIDGEPGPLSNTINFTANYTGNLSSRVLPYVVEYALEVSETYEGEMRSVRWNVSVIDVNRPPTITTYQPFQSDLWTSEGNVLYISVGASDPDGDNIDYVWELNGSRMAVHGPSLAFNPDFVGANSSAGSPFILVINVSDSEGNRAIPGVSWTVHVNDTDRPFIYSFDPAPGNLTVAYEEGALLSYNATDLDGTEVLSSWTCLGRTFVGTALFELVPNALGLSGNETVRVTLTLSSGVHSVHVEWNVTVLKKPVPPPVLPPSGVSIASPSEGQDFILGENVTLRAVANDSRELDFLWTVDGIAYSGKEVVLKGLEVGEHTAILKVSLLEDTTLHVTLMVNFTVYIEDKPPEKPDGSDGRSYLWLLLLLPLLALAIVPLLLVLFRRRDPAADWEE